MYSERRQKIAAFKKMCKTVAISALQIGMIAAGVKLLFVLSYVGFGPNWEFWLNELLLSAKIAVGIALFMIVLLMIFLVLPVLLLAKGGRAASPDQ
jgi:hypothetical protein